MRPKLMEAILNASIEKDNIKKATQEWVIEKQYHMYTICVCGQDPIIECCTIRNINTGMSLDPIGNECIKHFKKTEMDIDLKVLMKKTNMMKGTYEGMSFDDVVSLYPGYKPSKKELKKYKTLQKYVKFRNKKLEKWEKAITFIRPRIMAKVEKIRIRKREEKQKQILEQVKKTEIKKKEMKRCILCQQEMEMQYALCLPCYQKSPKWYKMGLQWTLKVPKRQEKTMGDTVLVVTKNGQISQQRLITHVGSDEWNDIWTATRVE